MSLASRKIVYKLMVASPIIFLATIAVHARLYEDPYEPVGFTPLQQQHMLAYRGLTILTRQRLTDPKTTDAEIGALSARWLEAYGHGKLQPLYPASSQDSMEEGIRGEILQTMLSLNSRLSSVAEHDRQSGDYVGAKNGFLASLDLSEIIKYSDFLSLNVFRIEQSRVLKRLSLVPLKSAKDRADVAARLKTLLENQRPLDHLAYLSRQQYYDGLRHAGIEPVGIEEPTSIADANSKPDELDLKPTKNVFMASDSSAQEPLLYSQIRVGDDGEAVLKRQIEAAIRKYSSPAK